MTMLLIRALQVLLIGLLFVFALRSCALLPSVNARKDAQLVFGEMPFERVLATRRIHRSGYGCTFFVLELPEDAAPTPPEAKPLANSYRHRFARDGAWQATPVADPKALDERWYCLTGIPEKLDGVGLEGHGPEIAEILQRPGAWYSSYGGSEHQILLVYAPLDNRALRLRFGD